MSGLRIWEIDSADDLQRVIEAARFSGLMRIADDGGTLKVKGGETTWSMPLGTCTKGAPLDPVAEDVLLQCREEAARSLEQNPVDHWSPADVAADVVRHLDTTYELHYRTADDERPPAEADRLYEKCLHCHLFVEPNYSWAAGAAEGLAPYVHSHRGDDMDERLDADHEPAPSGRKANLLTWKTYGPLAMRERFTS